jgi:hypothetical protein
MALALPAYANSTIRIGTMPALYEPPESEYSQPVSMSGFHFEANEETGRVRVVVDYDAPILNPRVYDPGPGTTEAEIPGLTWNAATRSVVYAVNGRETVCAAAQSGKKLKLQNTGACTVTATEGDHVNDNGDHIKVIETWFEAH